MSQRDRRREDSSSRHSSSTWSQRSRSSSRSSSPRDRDYRTSRHSRSPRDRDYRDLSRSRSRSRSRGRDRDHRGRYNSKYSPPPRKRERERTRSPFSRRRSPTETKPSNKVILTSLPNYADKDVLNILLAQQGFHPIDIRVVRRNTDSGLRVFGFVEFSEVKQAEDWINYNQGYLKMEDGFQVRLEYSREESTRERPVYNPLTSDWTCSKCTINNFNRRTSCFKCGTTRKDSEALDAKGYGMVGVQPSDTLLIRELPSTVTEESVRSSLTKYTGLTIQRVQLASSRLYAFAQMKSAEEAGYMLQVFNKVVPYVDNCAVIITYSRQSLNQILIMENVNLLKTQSGISSASIQEDPTNSAAQLAQNAIRLAQMGKAMPGAVPPIAHMEGPARQSISTPFGYLPTYATPEPNTLRLEPSSGYHWDPQTGFYFDSKTGYYYNPNTSNWMFWSSKFSTYINCEGGDLDLKRQMQEEERQAQQLSQSAVISAPPTLAVDVDKEQQLKLDAQALASSSSSAAAVSPVETGAAGETDKKRRKKQKSTEEEKDSNMPKTPQEIQKEMQRWARRQEKIKMSFNKPQEVEPQQSMGRKESVGGGGTTRTSTTPVVAIKKPWDDDDEEEEADAGTPPPSDAVLPGRMRTLTNRQARVRMGRAVLDQQQQQQRPPAADDGTRCGGVHVQLRKIINLYIIYYHTGLLCHKHAPGVVGQLADALPNFQTAATTINLLKLYNMQLLVLNHMIKRCCLTKISTSTVPRARACCAAVSSPTRTRWPSMCSSAICTRLMLLKRYGKLKRQLQGAMGRQALTVRKTNGSSNTGTGPKKGANNMDMIQDSEMMQNMTRKVRPRTLRWRPWLRRLFHWTRATLATRCSNRWAGARAKDWAEICRVSRTRSERNSMCRVLDWAPVDRAEAMKMFRGKYATVKQLFNDSGTCKRMKDNEDKGYLCTLTREIMYYFALFDPNILSRIEN